MRIRKEVKELMVKVIKKYDDSLDHGKVHIADVVKNVWKYIRRGVFENIQIEMLLLAAVYHDIGLTIGSRKNHEEVAYKVVLEDEDLKKLFDEECIQIIADCCLHHRTSKTIEDMPFLSKIIHDSDNSIDIEMVIKRGIATRMNKIESCSDENLNWIREDILNYLDMKHGSNGYKKFYLELPEESKEKLKGCKKIIDNRESVLFTLIEKYINKLKW